MEDRKQGKGIESLGNLIHLQDEAGKANQRVSRNFLFFLSPRPLLATKDNKRWKFGFFLETKKWGELQNKWRKHSRQGHQNERLGQLLFLLSNRDLFFCACCMVARSWFLVYSLLFLKVAERVQLCCSPPFLVNQFLALSHPQLKLLMWRPYSKTDVLRFEKYFIMVTCLLSKVIECVCADA